MKKRSAFWWLWATTLGSLGIGLGGLSVAFALYNDNLLGGWAVLFGPIYWLGQVLLLVALVVSLLRVLRRFRTARNK